LLIDISADEQVRADLADEAWFDLILRPWRRGFLRLPRVRRIVANAIEIEQQESVVEEVVAFGQGRPGQTYKLGRTGRASEPGLSVMIADEPWRSTDDLSHNNPDDRAFEFNQETGELLFGNGINGRLPPAGAPLQVAYDVCAGALGNAPANMRWSLRGVSGIFGSNSRACRGGADATQFKGLQAGARRALAQRDTYVTSRDLEEAARALPLLHVVRAHELPPQRHELPGTRNLLVVAAALPGLNPDTAPENPLWLAAVRARLSPHLLAGQRLVVMAARRVRLEIRAKLQVVSSADPAKVKKEAREFLTSKFIDPNTGEAIWKFGRDVTLLMVTGWLRKIEGVRAIVDVTLARDGVVQEKDTALAASELATLRIDDVRILIERLPVGASP
jgi:predicted phage baseplate assembly protein